MNDVRWLTDDEIDTWLKFRAVVELYPGLLDAQLRRDSQLTHMEYQVLAMLSEQPDRTLRMTGLATRSNSSLTRMSHVVTRLEARGIGKGAVKYKLRDWLFSRQRYWGEPFPVIHMEDGSTRLVAECDLPLNLPELEDFKPTGTGEPPLSKAGEWLDYTDPETGLKGRRETNTMPQWAGSCWYYLRYIDPHNERAAVVSAKEK